jgi:hypothetical protein
MRRTAFLAAAVITMGIGFASAASADDIGVPNCLIVHDVSAGPGGAHVGQVEFYGIGSCV